jgi:putative effector of murein hydrolase
MSTIKLISILFGILIIIAVIITVDESYKWYNSGLPAIMFMTCIFVIFCAIWYYFEYKACSKYNP